MSKGIHKYPLQPLGDITVDYKFESGERVRCIGTENYGQTGTVSFCVPGNGSNPHVNIHLDSGQETLLPEWEVENE